MNIILKFPYYVIAFLYIGLYILFNEGKYKEHKIGDAILNLPEPIDVLFSIIIYIITILLLI